MMRRTFILFIGIFVFATTHSAGLTAQNTREEFGKCGYYADALHGRKTASGEIYDKNLLTCSHKSLPFGTSLKVTRLDNGKSVVVRVNDRGPFIDGYVVDLSRKAAEAIGLLRDGVTKVRIEVLAGTSTAAVQPAAYSTKVLPASLEASAAAPAAAAAPKATSVAAAKTQLVKSPQNAAPATGVAPAVYSSAPSPAAVSPAPMAKSPAAAVSEVYQVELKTVKGQGFGLQLAVLTTTENLFQQIAQLQSIWPGKVVINHEEANGVAAFKLIIGPYATRKEAANQQKKAAARGFKSTFVVAFE